MPLLFYTCCRPLSLVLLSWTHLERCIPLHSWLLPHQSSHKTRVDVHSARSNSIHSTRANCPDIWLSFHLRTIRYLTIAHWMAPIITWMVFYGIAEAPRCSSCNALTRSTRTQIWTVSAGLLVSLFLYGNTCFKIGRNAMVHFMALTPRAANKG